MKIWIFHKLILATFCVGVFIIVPDVSLISQNINLSIDDLYVSQDHRYACRDFFIDSFQISDSTYYVYYSQETQNSPIAPHHAIISTSNTIVTKGDNDYEEDLPEYFGNIFFYKEYFYLVGTRTNLRSGDDAFSNCVVLYKFDKSLNLLRSKELFCHDFLIHKSEILSVNDENIIVDIESSYENHQYLLSLNHNFDILKKINQIPNFKKVAEFYGHSFIKVNLDPYTEKINDTLMLNGIILKQYSNDLKLIQSKIISNAIELKVEYNDSLLILLYKKLNDNNEQVVIQVLNLNLEEISKNFDSGFDESATLNGIILKDNFLYGVGRINRNFIDSIYGFQYDFKTGKIKSLKHRHILAPHYVFDAVIQNENLIIAGENEILGENLGFIYEFNFNNEKVRQILLFETDQGYRNIKKFALSSSKEIVLVTNDQKFTNQTQYWYPFDIKVSINKIDFEEGHVKKVFHIPEKGSSKMSCISAKWDNSGNVIYLEEKRFGFTVIQDVNISSAYYLFKSQNNFSNKQLVLNGFQNLQISTKIIDFLVSKNNSITILSEDFSDSGNQYVISSFTDKNILKWEKYIGLSFLKPLTFISDSKENIYLIYQTSDSLMLRVYNEKGDPVLSKFLLNSPEIQFAKFHVVTNNNEIEIIGLIGKTIIKVIGTNEIKTYNINLDLISFIQFNSDKHDYYVLEQNNKMLQFDLKNNKILREIPFKYAFESYEFPLNLSLDENGYWLWTSRYLHIFNNIGEVVSSKPHIKEFYNFKKVGGYIILFYENAILISDTTGQVLKNYTGFELFGIDSIPNLKPYTFEVQEKDGILLFYGGLSRQSIYGPLNQGDVFGAAISFMAKVTINNLSSTKNERSSIQLIELYPNPTTESIIIKNENINTSEIYLFDSQGIEISAYNKFTDGTNIRIKFSQKLPSGTYYVLIKNFNQVRTAKFLIIND